VRRAVLAAAAVVVLAAAPAYAENPVLDPADDAEIAEALARATEVQDVCYGYLLSVLDNDTGRFSGDYAVSNAGPGVAASTAAGCTEGFVELRARLVYTSTFSEAEDGAGWVVQSSLGAGAPTVADLGELGLSAGDLVDDATAPTALRNAVLALPALTAERAGVPPVQLVANDDPLPEGAQATGSPGSDWWRTHASKLGLCLLALLAGTALLVSAVRQRPRPARAPLRTDPPPGYPPPAA
jgi:hypothetical protein